MGHFWTDLVATKEQGGDYWHGIALSRLSGVALNAGAELVANEDFTKCIKDVVLAKAIEEFNILKPHFQKLSAGKGSQTSK